MGAALAVLMGVLVALLVVPLAWCVFSGAMLWAMQQPHALVLPLAGAGVTWALMRHRR